MLFIGINHHSINGVFYDRQPLRGWWYDTFPRWGWRWWNNLKKKDPRWQIAEICVDFWAMIYGQSGCYCHIPNKFKQKELT